MQAIDQPAAIPAKAGIQAFLAPFWIPGYLRMTGQQLFEKANEDKTGFGYPFHSSNLDEVRRVAR
jgi:hypothetical protein